MNLVYRRLESGTGLVDRVQESQDFFTQLIISATFDTRR